MEIALEHWKMECLRTYRYLNLAIHTYGRLALKLLTCTGL
jgi:hypothetical protein